MRTHHQPAMEFVRVKYFHLLLLEFLRPFLCPVSLRDSRILRSPFQTFPQNGNDYVGVWDKRPAKLENSKFK